MSFELKPRTEQYAEEKISEREIALFGVKVESGDLLENIYSYLNIEDLELLATYFGSDFDMLVFNGLVTEDQWKQAEPILERLAAIMRECKEVMEDVVGNPAKMSELRKKYRPTLSTISKELGAL